MEVIQQIGYYSDPKQTMPEFDPCKSAPCCVCGQTNGNELLTYRSLMPPLNSQRSYFFAYHSKCKGSDKINAFEFLVADEMFDWEDATKT